MLNQNTRRNRRLTASKKPNLYKIVTKNANANYGYNEARAHQIMNLNEDEWICAGATTAKEATTLLEHGFQYQTTIEGIQLFKKRK
jgi:hypothetical protein